MALTATLEQIKKRSLQASSTSYVSGAELAQVFGLIRSTIYHYQKELGLPRVAKDMYDLKLCCAWYIEKLKKDNEGNQELSDQKALLMKHKAEKAKIENSILEGQTLYVSDVEKELQWAKPHRKSSSPASDVNSSLLP